MAYVQGELGKRIETLMQEADSLYNEGNVTESIAAFEAAWELLPDEKYQYDESFLIVWSILAVSLQQNDVVTMNRWIAHVFKADPERADIGEREMWGARVAMASGQTIKAFQYMDLAVAKSRGRCFEQMDGKLKKAYYERKENAIPALYQMKFWFEHGGTCLWSVNDEAVERYDYAVDHHELPLSVPLLDELDRLEEWYHGCLDWDCPSNPSPWDKKEWAKFKIAANKAYKKLVKELGKHYEVLNNIENCIYEK